MASPVRWPPSFSRAIRHRDRPDAATNSRLPRRASAARVPDRARIVHRLSSEREEGAVLVLQVAAHGAHVDHRAGQARPGSVAPQLMSAIISRRDSGVLNCWAMAPVTPMKTSPRRTEAAMIARRESRIVLP